jgi:hypothetical protein
LPQEQDPGNERERERNRIIPERNQIIHLRILPRVRLNGWIPLRMTGRFCAYQSFGCIRWQLWPSDFVRLGDQAVGPYAARVDGHSSCSPSENRPYFPYSYFVGSSAPMQRVGEV